MSEVVSFDRVSKRYYLGVLGSGSLRSAVGSLFKRTPRSERQSLWALKDASFKIARGEAVGLVGPNGAGKSTTLRLISDITKPTSGTIAVNGRLATLLELGAGFHPELTGRENIFLYGSILGLKRRDIQTQFDSIVAFSELETFLDTPLKRYSSGMYVRLAFAVAAHVAPDILLVDEVLAVGDAAFRMKCMQRIDKLVGQGTTLLFVSHNAHMVRTVCDRALYLSQGQLKMDGAVDAVVRQYEHDLRMGMTAQVVDDNGRLPDEFGIQITNVSITDNANKSCEWFDYADSARINVNFVTARPFHDPVLHMRLWRSDNTACFTVRTNQRDTPLTGFTLDGAGAFALQIDALQLYGGKYRAEVAVVDSTDTNILAMAYSLWFQVSGPGTSMDNEHLGVYVPQATWQLEAAASMIEMSTGKNISVQPIT